MKVPALIQDWPVRASEQANLVIPLVLGAAIGTELARIALAFVIASHPAPPAPPPPVTAPMPMPSVNVASIVSAHLFGRPDAGAAQNPDSAPASTAGLKLVGTMAGRDPATGLALVSGEGKTSVLKIGESLTGAALRYVYADHVILDRDGNLERLSLEFAAPAAGQGIVRTAAVRPAHLHAMFETAAAHVAHRGRRHTHRHGHPSGARKAVGAPPQSRL